MFIHTVKEGETLYSIAALYGVGANEILVSNGLMSPETLSVGQSLVILIPKETYTLPGDSDLFSLSETLGISVRTLQRNNPELIGMSSGIIRAGTRIVLSFDEKKEGEIRTVGYAYPFINRETLEYALPNLSEFTVFTYGFTKDGRLVYPMAEDDAAVRASIAAGTSPVLLLSTLGENGKFDNTLSSALFANREAEEKLTEELLSVMEEKGYEGLDIDFEYVASNERAAYADFVARLTNRMNGRGYSVTVALAPKTSRDQPGLLYEAHDYEALGRAANSVLLMTYEWGYTYGPPQAVAPLDKVRRVVDYALSEVPREKILLGIPNYGYDWTLPYTPGTAARSLSPLDAVKLANETNSEILFDEVSASPYFYYTDGEGKEHVVWFEDARSFDAKLDLLREKGLAGYAVWTVMKRAPALFGLTNALFEIE